MSQLRSEQGWQVKYWVSSQVQVLDEQGKVS